VEKFIGAGAHKGTFSGNGITISISQIASQCPVVDAASFVRFAAKQLNDPLRSDVVLQNPRRLDGEEAQLESCAQSLGQHGGLNAATLVSGFDTERNDPAGVRHFSAEQVGEETKRPGVSIRPRLAINRGCDALVVTSAAIHRFDNFLASRVALF
jgi:hypothetical protein